MPSRFPGMDPFIEGQFWRDFHGRMANAISDALVPRLRPRYLARLDERVYVETEPEGLPRTIRPDVTILEDHFAARAREEGGVATLVEPIIVPLVMPEEIHEAYLEVQDAATHEVIAVIEVLSPTNKGPNSDGRREYLAKREAVIRSATHLVELDLLRGGQRMPMAAPLPAMHFYALVSRARRRPGAQVWPLTIRHRLPTIPIPLAGKDPDVPLDLQSVFDTVYDRAGYDYSLDYTREVEPPLDPEDAEWVRQVLAPNPSCEPCPS